MFKSLRYKKIAKENSKVRVFKIKRQQKSWKVTVRQKMQKKLESQSQPKQAKQKVREVRVRIAKKRLAKLELGLQKN